MNHSENDKNTRSDVKWKFAGVGFFVNFKCARCNLNKDALGRKWQMVKGARQFVCKTCVRPEA